MNAHRRTGHWLIVAALLTIVIAVQAAPSLPTPVAATSVTALMVLPEDGREPFIDEIEAATISIDLYLYLLSDEEIIKALIRAHMRGVEVRVMLEPEPFGGAQTELETWNRLDTAGVDVRWSPGWFRFSHVKMLVVDNTIAVIMNLNMTSAAFELNREFAILTTDPAAVGEALRLFDADWHEDPSFSPVHLVASPENSRTVVTELLNGATSSIDIYAEALTDQAIIDLLVEAHKRGVRVRVIVADLAGTSPEHEEPGYLARAGIDVRILSLPYVHAKAVIVDGQMALIGSQNLTANSLDENREVGIISGEPMVLTRLNAIFDADFAKSPSLLARSPGK